MNTRTGKTFGPQASALSGLAKAASFLNRSALTALAVSALMLAARSSQAINLQVNVTCDNVYAIYYGSPTTANTAVGYDNDWPTTESYSFNLPASDYIYVAAWTDDAVAQGFLAQFNNLDDNTKFYSSDSQWQVTATGLNKGTSDPQPTLAELTTQIGLANGGLNSSGGWVATTAGGANGVAPWGTRPGIDAAARWTWYNSGQDPSPNAPFNGFNHDEYLIFRIAVNAKPTDVPEPGAAALLVGITTVSAAVLRRRRK